MKFTNKYNIPETIVRATRRFADLYDKGPAHRSATGLVQSPRIDRLRARNFNEIEKDVVDEFWSVLGSAVHHILQMGADSNQVMEERLYAEIDGWTISGAIDVQNILPASIEIEDYKTTACYQVMSGSKDEWEKQLNIYRWLVESSKGVPVSRLSIIAILRDWARSQIGDPLYPPAPIMRIDVPLWPIEKTEAYIRERVNLHRTAEMQADLGLDLPLCSVEDRWGRGGVWKVFKVGGKRATKVCDTKEEAEAHAAKLGPLYEARQGDYTYVRCTGNYCQVAAWCSQYQGERAGGQNVHHLPAQGNHDVPEADMLSSDGAE